MPQRLDREASPYPLTHGGRSKASAERGYDPQGSPTCKSNARQTKAPITIMMTIMLNLRVARLTR